MPEPFLRGNRSYLAALDGSEEEAATNVRWFSDAEVTRHLLVGTRYPMTLRQERDWLAAQGRSEKDVVFGIFTKRGGLYIGNCGLHAIDYVYRNAEAGIAIGEKHLWGKGYGTEALALLVEYAFSRLNLHRVFLRVKADNARGIRSYGKVGFQREGTLREAAWNGGEYLDMHVMGLLEPEWRESLRRRFFQGPPK